MQKSVDKNHAARLYVMKNIMPDIDWSRRTFTTIFTASCAM